MKWIEPLKKWNTVSSGWIFAKIFMFRSNIIVFIFFWFLSKHFNRVVRTILYVIELTFWGNLFCFEKNLKKSESVEVFDLFPKNFPDISDEIFQPRCEEKFSKGPRVHFQGKRCFFSEKISFLFNSGFWAKMFTSLGKTFKQAYQKCNLAVEWSILKTFFEMIDIYFLISFQKMVKKYSILTKKLWQGCQN